MSAIPKQKLTAAQYLALERTAEFKSEFYRGEMFVMAGASREHNTLKENLVGNLFMQLKGGPCRSFSSDQRVKVSATGLYTYPDIVVVCGDAEYAFEDRDTLLNPQVIVEVLSESTEKFDRGKKFAQYQEIPSMREYVLVCQDQFRVERYTRQTNGTWVLEVFNGPASVFTLTTIPVKIPLSDIYAGVEFQPATDASTQA